MQKQRRAGSIAEAAALRPETGVTVEAKPSRRTRVKNRPGIWYRDTPRGRRYEVTYLDETGRRRWTTVDGNLESAQAALDEKRRRRRDGERVAPEKVRLSEFAVSWLEAQAQLRPRTRELYRARIERHVLPKLGRLYVHEIRVEDVTALIAALSAQGLSPYTIRGVVMLVGSMLGTALERGLVRFNPVSRLKRKEMPKPTKREMRILSDVEIPRMIAAADDTHRALLAAAVFTGLRQGELLGLTWADVDLDAGLVRVRRQLDRDGTRTEPKTANARREVEMFPALVRMLREHRRLALARGHASPEHPVFASSVGTPLHFRNVGRRGLDAAMKAAGIAGEPRLRFHDLRHTFASVLISQGNDVVFVSRQMGHASPSITLDVYGHLFRRAEHGQRMRDRMEATFGKVLGSR